MQCIALFFYLVTKCNINATYIFTMSLRALKGRGNLSLRAQRGNLNLSLRDRTACSEQSEGIFFVPRDDTGIISFVLVTKCGIILSLHSL